MAAADGAWRAQVVRTEAGRESLRRLNDRIEETKRKRNLLMARQKSVGSRRRTRGTLRGTPVGSAFEAFHRMTEKMETLRFRSSSSEHRRSRWRLRIDDRYHIAFRWTAEGAEDVEIVDREPGTDPWRES